MSYPGARLQGMTALDRFSAPTRAWFEASFASPPGTMMNSSDWPIGSSFRSSFTTLKIAFTVDDPKAYTRPWTVELEQAIVVDTDLIEEICLEGLKPMHLPPK